MFPERIDMGFFNKVGLHLLDKYVAPTAQGIKLGMELTENAPAPVKVVGFIGGFVAGNVVGAVRVSNPLDIADSVLTPEGEMEERVQKKLKAADMMD
jgi:hypothetical protein